MTRRLFPVFLGAALLLGALLPACDQPPRPVHLVIKTPMQEMNTLSNPNIRDTTAFLKQASAAFAEHYAKAAVQPDVKTFNYVDEVRAVTDSFGTETAPDILFGAFFNLSSYIDTGRAAPLDDMISPALKADMTPHDWDPGLREGRIYLLPYLKMQNILIYNKALFQQCGLGSYIGHGREIQNWTLPQWRRILDTLAARLPHGIYPLAVFAANNQGDTHILSYLRAFGGRIFDSRAILPFRTRPRSRPWPGCRRGCAGAGSRPIPRIWK